MTCFRNGYDSYWGRLWMSSLAVVITIGLQSCSKEDSAAPPEIPPGVPASVPQAAQVTPIREEKAEPESPVEDVINELVMDPPLPPAVPPQELTPVEAPPIEVPPVSLELREFADFQHEFTAEEMNPNLKVTFDNLPDGAAFDTATHVLTWTPPEGSGEQEYELIAQYVDGPPLSKAPRVILNVQCAYQPPEYIAPQPLSPKNDKHSTEQFVKHTQSILDASVSKSVGDDRFVQVHKACEGAVARCGADPRFAVARSLRMLEAGTLTVSDYALVVESLTQANTLSESRYLPAIYLKIWALATSSQMDEAIGEIPEYSALLLIHNSMSHEEVCQRLYELGLLIGIMNEKASRSQSLELDRFVDSLPDRFQEDEECLLAIQDGLNRMKSTIRVAKSQLDDKHSDKVEQTEVELEELIAERSQTENELKDAVKSLQEIQEEWNAEVAPLDAKIAPFETKHAEMQVQLDGLIDSAAACIANRDGYLLVLLAAEAEYTAAIEAGGSGDSAGLKVKAARADVLAEERRGVVLNKQINAKKGEMEKQYQGALPFANQKKRVNQKRKELFTSADQSVKKLQKQFDQLERRVSVRQGKTVAALRFNPSIAEFVNLNLPMQKKYLFESFGETEQQ